MVDAAERLTGKTCLTVGPGLKTGLRIRIDNPAQAGSDLIVGAVAAIAQYGMPLTIIDMGTATTITVVDRKGSFVGGTIHPGVIDYKGHSYLFYHNATLSLEGYGPATGRRSVCVDELRYREDGTMEKVDQTKEGILQLFNN